jgi:hypothetical protein
MNNNYEKNKEKIKKRQLYYYHKHKNNPDSSHYLPHRLKLQLKFNYGYYIISFL